MTQVKVKSPIWSCGTCHASLHVHCLKTWEKNTTVFRCPGCQSDIPEASVNYSCFCGKELDPVYSPLLTPHSCGGVCGRERECIHPCNALCHPVCHLLLTNLGTLSTLRSVFTPCPVLLWKNFVCQNMCGAG
jgi:transcriptional repressor NF-X1